MGLWLVSWVGMLVMLMGAVTIMVLGTLVTPGTLVTLSIWLVLATLPRYSMLGWAQFGVGL